MIHASRLRWLHLLWSLFFSTVSPRPSSKQNHRCHELMPNFIYLVHGKNPGIASSIFADGGSTIC